MPRSTLEQRPAALRWSLTAAAAAVSVGGAYFLDGYWLRALTEVFLIATVAQSINIIAGFTGYPAFGQVVFFGLGNYAAAIAMTTLEAPFLIGALLGSVICAGSALLCGWPLFRLKGHYFAIATLGLNEAVKAVVSNWVSLTKGGAGISLPLPSGPVLANARMFYMAFLALMWSASPLCGRCAGPGSALPVAPSAPMRRLLWRPVSIRSSTRPVRGC